MRGRRAEGENRKQKARTPVWGLMMKETAAKIWGIAEYHTDSLSGLQIATCKMSFLRAKGSSANQSRSGLRWLKVESRTVDSRRDDLEQTHWKKVWRSMGIDATARQLPS